VDLITCEASWEADANSVGPRASRAIGRGPELERPTQLSPSSSHNLPTLPHTLAQLFTTQARLATVGAYSISWSDKNSAGLAIVSDLGRSVLVRVANAWLGLAGLNSNSSNHYATRSNRLCSLIRIGWYGQV